MFWRGITTVLTAAAIVGIFSTMTTHIFFRTLNLALFEKSHVTLFDVEASDQPSTAQDEPSPEDGPGEDAANDVQENAQGQDATNPEDSNLESDKGPTKHFLKREQIWSREEFSWIPYDDATEEPPPAPRSDIENYFYINIRHERMVAKPKVVLSDFSYTLIDFLRAAIGDNFFYDDPEYPLESFLIHFSMLKARMTAVDEILSKPVEGDEDHPRRMEVARSVGIREEGYESLVQPTNEEIDNLLRAIKEHADVLLEYLEQEFKPTADRLALCTSYGKIEFGLLIYYFQPGQRLYLSDGTDVAFELTTRNYENTANPTQSSFNVEGFGHMWNGWDYVTYDIQRSIPYFEGTKALDSLWCQKLTDEVKERLTERGRIYTSLSGVHYRTYNQERVIIDRFAYDNQSGYIVEPETTTPEFEDENKLYMLPAEVYGFNLATKQFAIFGIDRIKPVKFDEQAWDHLVLDSDTKSLIKGLVEVTRTSHKSTQIISDVISGKGGGLIAVLHGPPGTGKTLTAEAVAEYLQRPLYMVGASDMAESASSLETRLSGILSLATAWDAVLLIDEADVFLEQRSLHELERNAIVSVALRVIEYHRGVLFLTTNRIKSFDEAFLSRFSISIKYPELDASARRIIWSKFFELANVSVGDRDSNDSDTDGQIVNIEHMSDNGAAEARPQISNEDLDFLASRPFNGRSIKNIVRTSQALASSRNETLSIEHVKTVVRTSEKFLSEFVPSA